MLSENGVWISYHKLDPALDRDKVQPRADATYLEDLRDMALAAARAGLHCPMRSSAGEAE